VVRGKFRRHAGAETRACANAIDFMTYFFN
jgi:hypothetical protein